MPDPACRVRTVVAFRAAIRAAFLAAAALLPAIPLLVATPAVAQPAGATVRQDTAWDVTAPRGQTREIDFTTTEGTWMSLDLSADGRWIVFDLLGHIYRIPAAGGEAESLTQASGVAVNFHPRISPDGRRIAFVSDRGGQTNLWVMDADGGNPRAVFTDANVRVFEPAWTPDGDYIIVRRQQLPSGVAPGMPGATGLWMYHRDGGTGIELVGRGQPGASWPAPSRDGRWLYFQVTAGPAPAGGQRDALGGGYQVRRMDLRTGEVTAVSAGESSQQVRSSSGGMVAPEVSPDGRWLAFARRVPDGTISFKGHRFGPRTALWLRDLETGGERLLMDPIEIDIAEGGKASRVLPGYAWSADGRSIVITQGGGLRRVDVATGEVATIPFRAHVRRTISEQAVAAGRITDDPFAVRFARWHTASPDGRTLAFEAVGRVWLMDLPSGTPRRLTPASFARPTTFEHAPAWSPDGRWLAFTTWDDSTGGHLWRAPARGGVAPERLTREPGEYIHPAWSPDGRELVLARGAGVTQHERGMVWNPWFDVVRVPAAGGEATAVVRVPSAADGGLDLIGNIRTQIVRPSWGPDGRIFFNRTVTGEGGPGTALESVRPDGSDRRTHLTFPYADEIVVAPDGRSVVYQEGDNVFVTPLPIGGTGASAPRIERRRGRLPVTRLSEEGGLFPRWRGPRALEFGSGSRWFAHDLDTGRTDTAAIVLRVPRDIPQGAIAFTNARIITLEERRVIERGTLVVRGSRIACAGDCDTAGADRVIDATGMTVVPGFIDVHSHNFREARGMIPARNYETAIFLAYGITTTMDPSMWSANIFPTAELTDAGLVTGSRVFSTGDPLYAGDGSRQWDLSSYRDAEASIARLQSWGAIALKQYMQPRRDQRQWVTDVARRRGLMVTSENGDLEFTIGMIMDGHTGFEHPLSFVPLYSDVARFLGQARAVYSATLVVGGPGPWNEEYFYAESELWRDAKQQRFMPWRQLVPHTRRRMLRPDTDYSFPLLAQGMADVIAEGGYGAIGAHGQQNGIASHWEVWMAASALGPMGALEVAALHGAHFIGRSDDLGSIRAGKLADLMLLRSNPLDDIRSTTDIAMVMKGGVLYDADTLDELWPRERPFGHRWWHNADAYRADDRGVDWFDRR